ncbi:MAG: DUF4244 domain-containing protein [Bifidobacteriaceae bacterium]|nr:DUF4244 domain-containing protein [Bifidobacteriaceae bacterium]
MMQSWLTRARHGGTALLQVPHTVARKSEALAQEVAVRWHVASTMPEAGMATAEYAVVLVAATGFAGLLVAILKSSAIKSLLTGIIKKALNV